MPLPSLPITPSAVVRHWERAEIGHLFDGRGLFENKINPIQRPGPSAALEGTRCRRSG